MNKNIKKYCNLTNYNIKENASCNEQEANFVLISEQIQIANHFHDIFAYSLSRNYKSRG